MKTKHVRMEVVLGAALLLLATSLALGATRILDFESAQFGNSEETCFNRPYPPLFNRPEYPSATSRYVVDPGGCGEGGYGPESYGSDSYLTNGALKPGDPANDSDRLTFSWDTNVVVSGLNWTDAAKELTATGAFTNLTDGTVLHITAGTGVTTGTYTISSKVSNDTVVLTADINGAGGDITTNTVAGWIEQTTISAAAWIRVYTMPYSWHVPPFSSPTVDLRPGSSISMKFAIYGFQSDGTTPVTTNEKLEFSLYLRETGLNLPLGEDGGTVGQVEAVGVDSIGVPGEGGTPVGGAEVAHREFSNPSYGIINFTEVKWTFVDTTDPVDGLAEAVDVSIDGGTAVRKSIVGITATANGILDAANFRGTLDSLLIRHQTADTTSKKWFVWIDDIVLDAPGVVDSVRIVKPVKELDTKVKIANIAPNALEVKLYKGAAGSEVEIASSTGPFTDADPTDPYNYLTHKFEGLTALVLGERLVAKEIVDIEGVPTESAFSAEVIVAERGTIENFDTGFNYATGPGTSGQYGWWYDVNSITWAYTRADTMPDNGSPCMAITDGGWTNGVYAIYQEQIPIGGTYHLRAKIHVIEPSGSAILDGFDQYQIGVIPGGTHRGSTGNIPPCPYYSTYTGLTAGNDTDIGPKIVRTSEFDGDPAVEKDILIALSTDVRSSWNGFSRTWNTWANVYILVDDLVLENGPPPMYSTADVPPVQVSGPLVSGAASVTVSDVGSGANKVSVYVNGLLRGELDTSQQPGGTKFVDVSGILLKGDVVTASQWYTAANGTTELQSSNRPSVVVGTGPNPAGVYLTLGVRETNATVAFGGDAGYTGAMEWVGATGVSNGRPVGGRLITPSNDWQTVTFYPWWYGAGGTTQPPAGYTPDPVLSYEAGNGQLNWSGFGTNAKGAFEHLAIVPATSDTGPYTLYIDNIKTDTTVIGGGFESYSAGLEEVMFRDPRYLTTFKDDMLQEPSAVVVDATTGDDSTKSLRVDLQFSDEGANRWCRLTTFCLYGFPSPYLPNPCISFTKAVSLRVKLVPRECKAVTAPTIQQPVRSGGNSVTVNGIDPTATNVTVYANATVVGQATGPGLPSSQLIGVTPNLVAGEFIYATQTVGGVVSCMETGVMVDDCRQVAAVTGINLPLVVGQTQVTVTGVNTAAEKVTVYADGVKIGENTAPGGLASVVVNTSALVGKATLSATQTMYTGLEGCVPQDGPMVGTNENTNLRVTLALRETLPQQVLPTGTDGGPTNYGGSANGLLEWLGASEKLGNGAPVGKLLVPGPDWQTLTFDPTVDPIIGYNGNGVLDGGRGVLDSIALVNDAGNPGPYKLYIDNVTAGGVNIGSFEDAVVNSTTMFKAPSNSGSTSANLLTPPNVSKVDGNIGDGGGQSDRFEWRFVDDSGLRWLRLISTDNARPQAHYIRNWLVLGPYPAADRVTAHTTDWLSGDGGEAAVQPEVGTVSTTGKTWAAHSTPATGSDNYQFINWDLVWGGDQTNVASYSVAYVYNHGAQRAGMFYYGSDDSAKIWWNGASAVDESVDRGHRLDQVVSAQVQVLAGWNTLVMKVSEGAGDYRGSCRLMDPATGLPMSDVGYATSKVGAPPAAFTATAMNNWNPVVDLTQPITLRVLFLRPGDLPPLNCNNPFADVDGDLDVDQADFAAFQRCFSGVGGGLYPGCACFDRLRDNDVDSDDAGYFEACASGAGIAANPACDGAP